MTIDLNSAGEQKNFGLIPANTIATLQIKVRGSGAGADGMLRRSKDGRSEGLDLELTVTEGPYAKRKLWALLTLSGETEGHAEAGRIAQATLRAILESAHGIKPDDNSEAARQRRQLSSYLDFDGLRFVGVIGVDPARDGYDAKNKLVSVITPDMKAWRQPTQVERAATLPLSTASPGSSGGIQRPAWSK
jgi:hypothetical protein